MELKQILERLTELKSEIGDLGKLPKEVLQKINYKFRLDWNYYSNRMEGGTLTREETRSVMVGNITVDGKPIKDVMEMNGHDEVVREILRMGKGEVRISEKRIKEIHKAIIKETDDPIKNKQIGTWKLSLNEIINYKGEKISFSAPADVAVEMHELLNKTNAMLDAYFAGKKDAHHPLIIAANFHLGFVSTHPFFDGNGRTARILMNLILIACGYPPIIITDSDKQAYYQYLADIQAYGGDKELMYFQMAGLELKSLMLVLKAAKGEDIEDEDDIDKEINLIQLQNQNKDLTKAPLLVFQVFEVVKEGIWEKLETTLTKFNKLFSDSKTKRVLNGYKEEDYPEKNIFSNPIMVSTKPKEREIFGHNIYNENINSITWLNTQYGLKGMPEITNIEVGLIIDFQVNNYSIKLTFEEKTLYETTKSYFNLMVEDDFKDLNELLKKHLLDRVKKS